jgi:microcystin-dependent protein
MVDQYVGEIKMAGFNFAPQGWALCEAQLLPIAQNQALFSLLGTYYGGNGVTIFALPDLQGRAAGHVGPNLYTAQGQKLGGETETLTIGQYPMHSHSFKANSTAGAAALPLGNYLSTPGAVSPPPPPPVPPPVNFFTPAQGAALQPLNTSNSPPVIGFAPGNGLPHENMMPFLVMNYFIALTGIYPSRN